jgi:hypothetical protein
MVDFTLRVVVCRCLRTIILPVKEGPNPDPRQNQTANPKEGWRCHSLTQQTERRGECTCFPTEKHAPSPAVSKVHRPISSRYVVFDHGYFLGSAVCVPVKPRSKYMPPTSSCPGLSPTPNPKTESNSTRQNTPCILSFDFFIFNFS